jgi:hypothetical protein
LEQIRPLRRDRLDAGLFDVSEAANPLRQARNFDGCVEILRLDVIQQLLDIPLVVGDKAPFEFAFGAVAENVQRASAEFF